MLSVNKFLVLLSAILLVTLSAAAPVSEDKTPSVIFRRAEYKAVTCGRSPQNQDKYSKKAVEMAFNELTKHMNKEDNDKPISSHGHRYPRKFHATLSGMRSVPVLHKLRKIEHCEPDQNDTAYLEFPLTENKFTGGEAGVDRVIAIVYGTKKKYTDPLYCLAVTHRDAAETGDHYPADTDNEAEEACN